MTAVELLLDSAGSFESVVFDVGCGVFDVVFAVVVSLAAVVMDSISGIDDVVIFISIHVIFDVVVVFVVVFVVVVIVGRVIAISISVLVVVFLLDVVWIDGVFVFAFRGRNFPHANFCRVKLHDSEDIGYAPRKGPL